MANVEIKPAAGHEAATGAVVAGCARELWAGTELPLLSSFSETALLAARFQDVFLVTMGTTLGMMAANAPAVLLGEAAARFAPLALVRTIAAGLFAVLGVWIIVAALL